MICVECQHMKNREYGECGNSDLPVTEHVHGTRDCETLNPKGDCKGFKPQAKPESIYETKKDEDLANTTKED